VVRGCDLRIADGFGYYFPKPNGSPLRRHQVGLIRYKQLNFLSNAIVWASDISDLRDATKIGERDNDSLNFFAARLEAYGQTHKNTDNRSVARDFIAKHLIRPTRENYDSARGVSLIPIPKKKKKPVIIAPPPVTKSSEYKEIVRRARTEVEEAKKEAYIEAKRRLREQGIIIVDEIEMDGVKVRFNGEYEEGKGVPWLRETCEEDRLPHEFEHHVARILSALGEEIIGYGDDGVRFAFWGPLKPGETVLRYKCADFVTIKRDPNDPMKFVINVREVKYHREVGEIFNIPIKQLKGTLQLVLNKYKNATIGSVEVVVPKRNPEFLILPDGYTIKRRMDPDESLGHELYDIWYDPMNGILSHRGLRERPLRTVVNGKAFVITLRMVPDLPNMPEPLPERLKNPGQ
jgi:hypothetical protein